MKRFFVRHMALILACLLVTAIIPAVAGAAEEGVSAKPDMTLVKYSGATAVHATNVLRITDGNDVTNYQLPDTAKDGLYLVYDLGGAVKINRLRIKIKNLNSLLNGTFSLYYTTQAYAEGQDDTALTWTPLLENDAPYASMAEERCFETVEAAQVKLLITGNAKPIIFTAEVSYSPLTTNYHVDAAARTITDIPKSEPIAAVKEKITAADGYSYKICNASGEEKTAGTITASDKLVITDTEGGTVEEYAFIPGSENTLLRSNALADRTGKANTKLFSIDLSNWILYQIPKSYTKTQLMNSLTMDYPGTIAITNPDDDTIQTSDRITVTSENGKMEVTYTINAANGLATAYGTSADITPGDGIYWWDNGHTTLWIPDELATVEKLGLNVVRAQGASLRLQTADGEEASGEIYSGMKLVSRPESGNAAELTEPGAGTEKSWILKRDYAMGKPATTSVTCHSSWPPEYATDGNKAYGTSRCAMGRPSGEITVDLGARKTFDSFSVMLWGGATKALPESFTVLVSNDNVTFKEVASYGESGVSLAINTDFDVTFTPVTARYVKCAIHENSEAATKENAILTNFSVFDSGDRVPVPEASISLKQNGAELGALQSGEITVEVTVAYGNELAESANLLVTTYKGAQISRMELLPLTLTNDASKTYTYIVTVQADETKLNALLWTDDLQALCDKKCAER